MTLWNGGGGGEPQCSLLSPPFLLSLSIFASSFSPKSSPLSYLPLVYLHDVSTWRINKRAKESLRDSDTGERQYVP